MALGEVEMARIRAQTCRDRKKQELQKMTEAGINILNIHYNNIEKALEVMLQERKQEVISLRPGKSWTFNIAGLYAFREDCKAEFLRFNKTFVTRVAYNFVRERWWEMTKGNDNHSSDPLDYPYFEIQAPYHKPNDYDQVLQDKIHDHKNSVKRVQERV